jgi:hypothetical protein
MNDIIFVGMNLEKENQFSAPFKKEDGSGIDFPLFPFFFPYFPSSIERRKKYLPIGIKEICLFPKD